MTPLLPCRPAILSPTLNLRFIAMYTLTILMTPRAKLVALLHLADLLVGDLAQHVDLTRRHLLDLFDLLIHAVIFIRVANALEVTRRDQFDHVAIKNLALVEQLLVGALVMQVSEHFLLAEDRFKDASSAHR